MIQLHPYNLGSRSAMALKGYLTEHGIRAIVSHRLASQRQRMIVGWGAKSFDFTPSAGSVVLNKPEQSKLLSCKLRFFDHVQRNRANDFRIIPDYTSSAGDAREWNDTVVVRATTTGSGGDGISIHQPGVDLPHAPLYVRYHKKTHEYRLHVFRENGEFKIGHIQRKVFVATPERPEPLNWQVRNHTQGFIFQTEETAPEKVTEVTLAVANCFPDLDFMALDVIYHKPSDVALVLEGNSAPGLEGPRLEVYGGYLKTRYEEWRNS